MVLPQCHRLLTSHVLLVSARGASFSLTGLHLPRDLADPQSLEVRRDLVPPSTLPGFNNVKLLYKRGAGESRWRDTVAEASQPPLPFVT